MGQVGYNSGCGPSQMKLKVKAFVESDSVVFPMISIWNFFISFEFAYGTF